MVTHDPHDANRQGYAGAAAHWLTEAQLALAAVAVIR